MNKTKKIKILFNFGKYKVNQILEIKLDSKDLPIELFWRKRFAEHPNGEIKLFEFVKEEKKVSAKKDKNND